jgi:hypothetical protein
MIRYVEERERRIVRPGCIIARLNLGAVAFIYSNRLCTIFFFFLIFLLFPVLSRTLPSKFPVVRCRQR